jgi:DNA-binding LacI/PurR family transcriptional regulator
VPPKKKAVSLQQVAHEVGLKADLVRDVLREVASGVPRETADRIFRAARKLGYDLRKLKIGKRMQYRKETLDEVLAKIVENEGWGRPDIVKYLKESLALVERVHRRVFKEEFGAEPK